MRTRRSVRAVSVGAAFMFGLVIGLCSLTVAGQAGEAPATPTDAVPTWRDEASGTAYLGRDVLWRPREWLVFHMYDQQGEGFELDLTVRDMNTYMQGPRPTLVWVVGPDDTTLARHVLEDDGVVAGNEQYRDGIYDPWQDARYRAWHHAHSPGGTPPGKQRSPYLEDPQRLPSRKMHVTVPAGGKGVYRVVVIGSWDHWISITPSRPMPTGVHPGPGPLYVHGDQLSETYLYAPPGVKDIGLSITEEVEPFNWRMTLENVAGQVLAQTTPRSFLSYMVHKATKETSTDGAVYRLRVEGETSGASLHVQGLPALFCPDAETARLLAGGAQVDEGGGWSFHESVRTLDAWAKGVPARALHPPDASEAVVHRLAELDEAVGEAAQQLPTILTNQNLDHSSARYGRLASGRKAAAALAKLVAFDHEANPWHASDALIHRIMLDQAAAHRALSPFFWFSGSDAPAQIEIDSQRIPGNVPFRSGWYALGGDAWHVNAVVPIHEAIEAALPSEAVTAWKRIYDLWAEARWMMHVGEVSNQWTYNLVTLQRIWQVTDHSELPGMIRRQIETLTMPGLLGRVAPDPTPYSHRSRLGYTYAGDAGLTGAGFLADGFGFDSQYTSEQVDNLTRGILPSLQPQEQLLRWLDPFYVLKTHLTLPKDGQHTTTPFTDTSSPTDLNFRTTYYTHKGTLPEHLASQVSYGELWNGTESPEQPWPALRTDPFVKNIDNRFYFVNTPGYYSIVYAGPSQPVWVQYAATRVEEGSAWIRGYTGPGYQGKQRRSTKAGGLSTVFVRGVGPTMLSSNADAGYSNVVWGRRKKPVTPLWEKGEVDPTIICAGFVSPRAQFDESGRVYRTTRQMFYEPLSVSRTVHFDDQIIRVTLELLATDTVDLVDLYECLPFVADHRRLRLFGEELEVVASRAPRRVEAPGRADELATIDAQAIEITGDSGAGTTLVLDQAYELAEVEPTRYRSVALATGSFNVPLPTRMEAGQRHVLRYVIVSHDQPMTPQRLEQIIDREGLSTDD